MTKAGVYLGHMENQLTGTSNAGAVTHATGTKVFNKSFGLEEDNTPIRSASGKLGYTILEEAIASGKATALIQSGHIGEPGTAAFAAATTNRDGNSIRAREKTVEIAEQVIRSGTQVILAGGEVYRLPKGTLGFHVTAEIDARFSDAEDRPTQNLIALAQSLGYKVVYTRDQFLEAARTSTPATKLLGIFAANHTFDDRREESLGLNTDAPLPLYVSTAPTVAEMLAASLEIVGKSDDGFFVVVEEEGTDNFANNNNAIGTIEATRHADAAIGVAMNYVDQKDPNTLVITAADSDAGGMQVFQFAPYTRPAGNFDVTNPNLADTQSEVPFINVNRTTTNTSRVFLDGPEGSTATPGQPWTAFGSVNSVDGPMGNFGIAWAGTPDFPGSIFAKTYGMNADLLPSTVDNTGIYGLMYTTLFGIDPLVLAQRGEVLVGTEGNDTTLPGQSTVPGFDGRVSTVFTGAGNDEVDGAITNGFDNKIFTGSGADVVYAGSRDVITGGSGNDQIWAIDGGQNRLSDMAGDDEFIIGSTGNRALGGAGNDIFTILGGAGTNHLNGGAGADQFWLVSEPGDRPAAKQFVMDFTAGVDTVGLRGVAFADLGFSQVGAETLLSVSGVAVGHFTNISASALNNQANFALV